MDNCMPPPPPPAPKVDKAPPPPLPHGDCEWINGTEFAAAANSIEWDVLFSRGGGAPPQRDLTRDSLFAKFDPIVQKLVVKHNEKVDRIEEEDEGRLSGLDNGPLKDQIVLVEEGELTRDSVFAKSDPIVQTLVVQQKEEEDGIQEEAERRLSGLDYHPLEEHIVIIKEEDFTKDSLFEKSDPIVQKLVVKHKEEEDRFEEEADGRMSGLDNHPLEEHIVLIKERDDALEDLRNVENAFSDLHKKYERSKAILLNLKDNEAVLVKRDDDLVKRIAIQDQKMELYKVASQKMVEEMYQDYENKIKELEGEITRLKAQCRLMEMTLEPMEKDVKQKSEEILKLRKLCDELINTQNSK